jgi:hypothetical protein
MVLQTAQRADAPLLRTTHAAGPSKRAVVGGRNDFRPAASYTQTAQRPSPPHALSLPHNTTQTLYQWRVTPITAKHAASGERLIFALEK